MRMVERIFKNCGVEQFNFYYPYPDYKFMTTLYSDVYLPGKGELCNNLRNFDSDRMVLFNEKNAFDGVIEDGYFSVFSNSYMVVIGEKFDVKYARYSNDRAPQYAIRTEILRDVEGKVFVRKYPLTPEAHDHIRNMAVAFEQLSERYEGSGLDINVCELVEDEVPYVEFEFIQGRTLSELFDECLNKDDTEGFRSLFKEYIEKIGYNSHMPVSDFDMAFSNIIVYKDKWTVIDYEWTFGKAIDTKELAFRAIYCYLLEDEKRDKLDLDFVLTELGITEADAQNYRQQEMDFQKFVTGQKRSMSEIRELMGREILEPVKWLDKYKDASNVERVQIYEDKGNGYSEEESYFVPDAYIGSSRIEFDIEVSGDVRMIRIDPAMDYCVVKIHRMEFNEEKVPCEKRKIMITNGKVLKGDNKESGPSIAFATNDPNININLERLGRKASNKLSVEMEAVRIPQGIAQDF